MTQQDGAAQDDLRRAGITADWLGAQAYPYTPIRDAWDLLMLTQFHDILPGTSVPKAYEYSWNDDVVALNRSAGALSDSAGAVIRGMDTRVKGVALVVYNPLATARQDIVEAVVRMPKATKYVRVYGPDGVEVPSQVLSGSGAYIRVLFLAKAPSVGFTTYDVRPSNTAYKAPTGLRVTKNSLEHARYLVTLNEHGDVAQIKDRTSGPPGTSTGKTRKSRRPAMSPVPPPCASWRTARFAWHWKLRVTRAVRSLSRSSASEPPAPGTALSSTTTSTGTHSKPR